jgi:putative heme-binding domain-containing protein
VAWSYLADDDRFIRWAARTAIEQQPVASWSDKALAEPDAATRVEALLALARVAGVCPQHRTKVTPPVDEALRAKLLDALLNVDGDTLDNERRLTLVRTIQITLNRFGRPDDARVAKLMEKLDPVFPSPSRELNWLLCETLVYLQSPHAAAKGLTLIANAPTQEEQIEYARSLRMLCAGWTIELRTAYFEWFLKAANYRGGASFEKFIEFIRTDAVATLSDAEKTTLAEVLAKQPEKKSAIDNLSAIFAGRKPTEWQLDELSAATQSGLKARSFENGRKMFAAGACFTCHRFGNEGGMTGPDLSTAGRRYSPHDLLDQIINPSKVINEQFSAVTIVTDDGKTHTGVVVNLAGDTLTLNTDLTDPNKRVTIDRKEIEVMKPSQISPMPANLLALLTKDEVLDLLAYVLSGGEPTHDVFNKK